MRGLSKFLFVRAFHLFFTVVKQTKPTCSEIEAVISRVTDEHDAGSVVNVEIFGNIHEEVIGEVSLNPVVEHAVKRFEIEACGVLNIKFEVDMLKFHVSIPYMLNSLTTMDFAASKFA